MSADDWVCIFVLLAVQMRFPAQGTTGGWVMLGLVFKWFPLCDFPLFDTPQGQFSASLGSLIQCSHYKGSGLDLCSRTKIPQAVCYDIKFSSVQFISVAQSCPTLCNPTNRSMPGLLVHHHLPEFTQTHIHRIGDAIQPSHPLSSVGSRVRHY